MSGMIDELVVDYDPTNPTQTATRRRRLFRGRLISLAITVIVMIIFYVWQRSLFGPALWVLYGIGLSLSVGWAVVHLIGYLQARRVLRAMGSGTALRVGRGGAQVGAIGVGWPQVAALEVVKPRLGQSPMLRLRTTGGAEGVVPLDQIPVYPATLDSTARAYSAGRFGVDLSALDN